jgi:hypothetical protein
MTVYKDVLDNYPLVFWKSVLDMTDFSTDAGGTPGAAWSPDTYTYWQSDATGGGFLFAPDGLAVDLEFGEAEAPLTALTVDLDFAEGAFEGIIFNLDLHNSTGADVNYIALQGHNFFINGSGAPYTFQLFYSADGVTFSPCFDAIEAENSGAIAVCFDTQSAEYFRLVVTSEPCSETFVSVAHLRMGEFLTLQRKVYVGISPFTLNKRVDKTITVSENGKYLGAHVKSTVNLYALPQLDNTPAFIRSDINDFLDHVDLLTPDYNLGPAGTFFCAWRPSEYPDEILYCHPGTIERPTNQRSNGMMQWKISGEAEA